MLAVVLVAFVGAFGGVKVGVARHADHVGVLDGVHAENFGRHHLDGVLQQDELQPVARQLDDARALLRHGHQPQRHAFGSKVFRLVGLGRLVRALRLRGFLAQVDLLVQAHHNVQGSVFKMRKRVTRVDDLRRQKRQDVLLNVAQQEGALVVGEVFRAQMAYAALTQQAANLLEGPFLDGVELAAARVDRVELLGGRHVRLRVDDVLFHQGQVGQAAHAHHEELLQVAPEDGDEVQPLEQRHRFIGSLVEHALVEREPRQLAVLQVGRRLHALARNAVRGGCMGGWLLVVGNGRACLRMARTLLGGGFDRRLLACFHELPFPYVPSTCADARDGESVPLEQHAFDQVSFANAVFADFQALRAEGVEQRMENDAARY